MIRPITALLSLLVLCANVAVASQPEAGPGMALLFLFGAYVAAALGAHCLSLAARGLFNADISTYTNALFVVAMFGVAGVLSSAILWASIPATVAAVLSLLGFMRKPKEKATPPADNANNA